MLRRAEYAPQGFVDLALVCSFTRMVQVLNGSKGSSVRPEVVAKVRPCLTHRHHTPSPHHHRRRCAGRQLGSLASALRLLPPLLHSNDFVCDSVSEHPAHAHGPHVAEVLRVRDMLVVRAASACSVRCRWTRQASWALSTQEHTESHQICSLQVAEVLRGSEALVVSEDGRRVRRAVALESPQEVARAIDERSLYAAPFPYSTTLDDLTAFFNRAAPVNCVRQRRHLASKDFKGSCFVRVCQRGRGQPGTLPRPCHTPRAHAVRAALDPSWHVLSVHQAVNIARCWTCICPSVLPER